MKIWLHETALIFRDKGILIFVVFVPLMYPLLYSWVYTNEVVRDVPLAVVDDSDSHLSREIVRKLDATPDVSVAARCVDMAQAQELVKRHEAYGILRIPASLENDITDSRQTYLGLYCDMSSMLYYKALLLAATNVSLEVNKDIKVDSHISGTTDRQDDINRMPIEYEYVALYNPQSGFAAFLIPPVLMLIIQQTLLLGIGMAAGDSRERNRGRLTPSGRLYRHPVSNVIGTAIPFLLLYVLMAVYMFTVVGRTFTLPSLGDYGTFVRFAIPYILACIFLAMVLSSLIYRREDCILLIVFLSVPLLFLSGLSWPVSSMPDVWRYVSYLFPSTFGMNGYVRISSMGATLADVKSEYMALWVQTGIYFLAACAVYAHDLRKRSRQVALAKA